MSYVLVLRGAERKFKIEVADHFFYAPNVSLEINRVSGIGVKEMVERINSHILRRYENNCDSVKVFVIKTDIVPYLKIRITINYYSAIEDVTDFDIAMSAVLFTLLYINRLDTALTDNEISHLRYVESGLSRFVVEYPEANK